MFSILIKKRKTIKKIKVNFWKSFKLILMYCHIFFKILFIMEEFMLKILKHARWISFVHFWFEFSMFIQMILWKNRHKKATGKVLSKLITMWNSNDNLGRQPISQKNLVKLKLRLNRHSINFIGKSFRRALLLRLHAEHWHPSPNPNPLNLENMVTHK